MGVKPIDRERQDREDMQYLVQRPEFNRFLLRVIQSGRILSRTTDGSPNDCLLNEGRRSLGLDILSMVEAGQPASHPDLPAFTLIQVLREEAIQQQEPTNEKRRTNDRYDRTDELDADEDDADRA